MLGLVFMPNDRQTVGRVHKTPRAIIRRRDSCLPAAPAMCGDGGRRSAIGWGFEPPLQEELSMAKKAVTMTRQSPAQKPIKVPEKDSKTIVVSAKDEAEAKKRIAELFLSPELNAARLTCAYSPNPLDLMEGGASSRSRPGPRPTATCRRPRRC